MVRRCSSTFSDTFILSGVSEFEDEISALSSNPTPSAADQKRLKDLKTELENINKKKEEYVAEHPEHRRLVYRARKSTKDHNEDEDINPVERTRKLFDKNGIPIHPERSIYYDPVMNPFGVAPPGMPYLERRMSFEISFIMDSQ